MLARAGDRIAVHHAADVDAEQVVARLAAVGELDAARRSVDAGDGALNEFGARRRGERLQRDREIVLLIVAGDPSGQHARIQLTLERRHQRDLRARHRFGGEGAQHLDMGMASAEQDESLHEVEGTRQRFIVDSPLEVEVGQMCSRF